MATVNVNGVPHDFDGEWIEGSPWERFGLYNTYVIIRADGAVREIPAHAGELVPGSTEDLVKALRNLVSATGTVPRAPMTLELDTTYRCTSRDCGGSCFSAQYRAREPSAAIPVELAEQIIDSFAEAGGRILRFDGGGDPLAHPAVRSGDLIERATRLGLKTTILTSGDLLKHSALERIAESNCYVRVSLNAATDEMRRRFHGNEIPLSDVIGAIESLSRALYKAGSEVPVGATFLLGGGNYQEVLDCARIARDIGIGHFSARRVLGPSSLRPTLSEVQELELQSLLDDVRAMHSKSFRVAVPWRSVMEADLNPSSGDFRATQCWQSTFKTVIEPAPEGARAQLCGRYRGGGFGQIMQLPPLLTVGSGESWVERWRTSFSAYPVSRVLLPRTCVSCIDRGFILMMEQLFGFVGQPKTDFRILHLNKPLPEAKSQCV